MKINIKFPIYDDHKNITNLLNFDLFKNLVIIGPQSSGKTESIKHFCLSQAMKDVLTVYIDLNQMTEKDFALIVNSCLLENYKGDEINFSNVKNFYSAENAQKLIDFMKSKNVYFVFDNYNTSEEEEVAKLFCHAAKRYFEGIEGNIYVLPNLKTQRELDLVVWMTFPKYKPTIKSGYLSFDPESKHAESKIFRTKKDIWFNSSLLIFELKKHNTANSISIKNGSIYVTQQDGLHNASKQSSDQLHPLKDFLMEKLEIDVSEVPRIIPLIWLYRWGNTKPECYEEVVNLILGEINFDLLLEQLCKINPPIEYANNKGNFIGNVTGSFFLPS
jgi:hypothetical protein